ncbi:MAG: hypothetical protein IH988_11390 [Planctomycetes bacterium]|nr:hypothetical protein [Planctomycetota bacterium]
MKKLITTDCRVGHPQGLIAGFRLSILEHGGSSIGIRKSTIDNPHRVSTAGEALPARRDYYFNALLAEFVDRLTVAN